MTSIENDDSKTETLLTRPMGEIPSVAGWKEVPIIETERSTEPLVPLGVFSDHRNVFTSSVYSDEHINSPYPEGLDGSLTSLFVREGVAERLDKAASFLPSGLHLMAMDTYRTLEVQGALFTQYAGELQKQHPTWSKEEIETETQKYVSLPSSDPTRPSPHNTGASVDVVLIKVPEEVQAEIDEIDAQFKSETEMDWKKEYYLEMRRSELLRKHGKMLEFGTKFDHGGPEAALGYYEDLDADQLSETDKEAQANRRMLFHIMSAAGFEPYADEWWHFNDPASQMGAKVAGKETAEYGAAQLTEENEAFAKMRKFHHLNSVRMANGVEWIPPKGLEVHYEIARAAVRGNNPRLIAEAASVAKIMPTDKAA